jgi:hypothetical protein
VHGSFFQGLFLEQSISEIHYKDSFCANIFTKLKELIIAEVIGHLVSTMAGADRSLSRSAWYVIDHIAPIQEIHIGPTRESDDRYFHFP